MRGESHGGAYHLAASSSKPLRQRLRVTVDFYDPKRRTGYTASNSVRTNASRGRGFALSFSRIRVWLALVPRRRLAVFRFPPIPCLSQAPVSREGLPFCASTKVLVGGYGVG
jgi:hypothetical protein